jgi:heat shock protein HslJ
VHPAAAALALGLALALVLGGCGGDDDESEQQAEASSLENVPWVLSSGLEVEGWEQSAPSVTFADGTAGGSTGCNRYTGSYTVDGSALEFGTIASTQMACPPPADAVERAYLGALERVAEWRLDGDELVLLDGDDAELRYTAASPVGDWEVTAFLNGDAVTSTLAGTTLTATFAADGTLSGSSGCNRYTTTYTTDRGEIEIAPPAGTRMTCAEPEGVMEQEAAYLAALPTATQYRLDGGSLTLLSADGTYVVTYAKPAQP